VYLLVETMIILDIFPNILKRI